MVDYGKETQEKATQKNESKLEFSWRQFSNRAWSVLHAELKSRILTPREIIKDVKRTHTDIVRPTIQFREERQSQCLRRLYLIKDRSISFFNQ